MSRTLAAVAAAVWAAAAAAQQIPAQKEGHQEVEPGQAPAGQGTIPAQQEGHQEVEPGQAPAGQSESPSSGESTGETGEASASPGPADKPRPAMMAPLAKTHILLGIAMAGTRLVAVGDRGDILIADDGKHWTQVPVPVNDMLDRVRFRDANTGWAVGQDASIVVTHDGGKTWALQNFDPKSRALYDIAFLGGANLMAIGGYGTYYASSDDGAHWAAQNNTLTDIGQHLNAVTHLADGTLLIAGERGLLARSKDNGVSWELLDSPYTGSFFGVLPVGAKGAMVFGLRGHIFVSDDVGACPKIDPTGYDPYSRENVTDPAKLKRLGWRHIGAPTTESLFGGTLDGDAALLVGVNATVLRVDPVKGTATPLKSTASDDLSEAVKQGDRWVAVGRRGIQPLGDLQPIGAKP